MSAQETIKLGTTVERKTHPPLVSSDLLDGESESFRKCLLCDCIALDFSVLCSGCKDDWDAIP